MDTEGLPELFARFLRGDLTISEATEGRVWTYRPPEFKSRGKQFSRRNLLRRDRFWFRQLPTVTIEPVTSPTPSSEASPPGTPPTE